MGLTHTQIVAILTARSTCDTSLARGVLSQNDQRPPMPNPLRGRFYV